MTMKIFKYPIFWEGKKICNWFKNI